MPFDDKSNTAAAVEGRIIDKDEGANTGLGRLYASGWLKRGPTGIIGTNITDAKETVNSIIADVDAGMLPMQPESSDELESLLGTAHCNFIDWNEYKQIEAFEVRQGESSNPAKPRQKLLDREQMLTIAKQ